MAERESTVSAFELAQQAVERADEAYELALELETLLDAIGEVGDPPKWVFPLAGMTRRINAAAGIAHDAALKVRFQLERSAAA